MTTYTLTLGSTVKRSDGRIVSDQDADYLAWLKAGNVPFPVPAQRATGRQINAQASAAGVSAALNVLLTPTTVSGQVKPDDIRYFNSVGLDTYVPTDNPKVKRVLELAGVKDVPAFMAAALLLPA